MRTSYWVLSMFSEHVTEHACDLTYSCVCLNAVEYYREGIICASCNSLKPAQTTCSYLIIPILSDLFNTVNLSISLLGVDSLNLIDRRGLCLILINSHYSSLLLLNLALKLIGTLMDLQLEIRIPMQLRYRLTHQSVVRMQGHAAQCHQSGFRCSKSLQAGRLCPQHPIREL